MLQDFKDFINQGNVMDMAVGVIIGGAFGKIVSSLVEDIIMPIISIITGGMSFENLFISLDGSNYSTLSQAKEAGAAVFAYGNFIQATIDFLIIALVIFLFVRTLQKMRSQIIVEEEIVEEATTKTCPYCFTEIAVEATRCPNCTSKLEE